MLEKTLELLSSLNCQACGRHSEILTKGICASNCATEYRLDDKLKTEIDEAIRLAEIGQQALLNGFSETRSEAVDCFIIERYSKSCYRKTFKQVKETLKQGLIDTEHGREMFIKAMDLTEDQLPCEIGEFKIRSDKLKLREWVEVSSQEFDGF